MGVVTGCEACTIEGPACSPSTQDWLNFHRATHRNSKIVTPAIHKISREDPFMDDEKLELRSIIERAILGRNVIDGACAATDALISAGYRKQRVITTVEEANALPVKTFIFDSDECFMQKCTLTKWDHDCFLYAAEEIAYPAIVIQEPTDDEEMS